MRFIGKPNAFEQIGRFAGGGCLYIFCGRAARACCFHKGSEEQIELMELHHVFQGSVVLIGVGDIETIHDDCARGGFLHALLQRWNVLLPIRRADQANDFEPPALKSIPLRKSSLQCFYAGFLTLTFAIRDLPFMDVEIMERIVITTR
jgi:hypothetical protein